MYFTQVHEDASYEWHIQTTYQATHHHRTSKHYDYGSLDQDHHNISTRQYIWSSSKGELETKEIDKQWHDEYAYIRETTPFQQVLSAPQLTRTYNARVTEIRAQETESLRVAQVANREAWTPFSHNTPAAETGYEWDPEAYPTQPIQLQHDLQ